MNNTQNKTNLNPEIIKQAGELTGIIEKLQSISLHIEDLQDEHPLEAEYLRMRLLDIEYQLILSQQGVDHSTFSN